MERLANIIFFAIIVVIGYFAFPFFLPFILALIVAMILEPLIGFMMRKFKLNRMFSSASVLTIFFAFIIWVAFLAIKRLVVEGVELTKKVPELYESLVNNKFFIGDFYNSLSDSNKEYINSTIGDIVAKITEFITKYAGNLVGFLMAFPGYFIASIVFVVATYIISIELPFLKNAFLRFFEEGRSRSKMELVINKLKDAVIGFLQAQIIFSTLTFIICLIGLIVLKFELVIVISLLIVLVDLLPIVGTGTVLVPWGTYLLITGNFYQGLGLVILFVFITVFRRVIEPKLLGNAMGLNPLLTLVAMYIGLQLMGLIGMFIFPAILIIIQALEEAEFLKIKLKI